MEWFDEVRLTKLSDEDAGMLCKIRLTFKGSFLGWKSDAETVFGPGWLARAVRLREAGVLKIEDGQRSIRMTVVAPGDHKREQVRNAMRKHRSRKGLKA